MGQRAVGVGNFPALKAAGATQQARERTPALRISKQRLAIGVLAAIPTPAAAPPRTRKGALAGVELPQHDAKRVHVDGGRDLGAGLQKLRREVRHGAFVHEG
jgi:hypothetical protein